MGIQNRRAAGYIASFRQLLPHRLVPPSSLGRDQVLREPLFYNAHVTQGSLPVPSTGVWLPMILAGVTSVGYLMHPPPDLAAELFNKMHSALSTCWSTLLRAPDPPRAGKYLDTRFANRLLHARPDPDKDKAHVQNHTTWSTQHGARQDVKISASKASHVRSQTRTPEQSHAPLSIYKARQVRSARHVQQTGDKVVPQQL